MGCSSDTNFKLLRFNVYRYKDAINDRIRVVSLSANEQTERDIFCSVGRTLEPWGRSVMREEPRPPLKRKVLWADSLYLTQPIRSRRKATRKTVKSE